MKLTATETASLNAIINSSLDRSEEMWDQTLGTYKFAAARVDEAETKIPGHPYLKENEYTSDEFIAFMVDMRDSTKHLRQAISARTSRVSQMQRVFYEVSALLPAMAKVIADENGAVTEYLGDGALALFQMPKGKISERESAIYASSRAASKCLDGVRQCVNPILDKRYGLPAIEVGIGLAWSDAIITKFGLRPNTHVKVLGTCIYNASKLAKGRNEIWVHEDLERIWPTATNATLRFQSRRKFTDVDGLLMERTGS